MGTETIGVRRLYDALGCNIENAQEIRVSDLLPDGKQVNLYIGPNPPFGIMAIESEQYGIPGQETKILHTNTEYKSDCYLEISVKFDFEVDESVSIGLQNKDQEARATLLQIVNQRAQLLEKLIDTISGIVGLKIHRQLVLKPLIDSAFISSGPEPVSRFTGPSVEILESIEIKGAAQSVISSYLTALKSASEDSIAKGGAILHWLLKAWREIDPISKFVYLFIPLEAILQSELEVPNDIEKHITSLAEMIRVSDREDKKELLQFLTVTKSKYGPTLNARFEEFAKNAAIPGWEEDIAAFKKYNRMRNLLVHAGRRNIRTHLNIEEETRTLEDLVERYLGIALMGNHNVYTSRFRPSRETVA